MFHYSVIFAVNLVLAIMIEASPVRKSTGVSDLSVRKQYKNDLADLKSLFSPASRTYALSKFVPFFAVNDLTDRHSRLEQLYV